ncbi:MAG: heme-binding beta-barrel domain-containing protein [Bdellovibrionales bacterium]|nr:heme-binding beta-barrel domain-containing protein [Bdellovibrionales bacterium]
MEIQGKAGTVAEATPEMLKCLGPLAPLIGIWEGDKGDDIAPSDDRQTENNKYRERMVFEAIGPINNHEQCLYGLKYWTTAWRIGATEAFHEDMGYWLWDARDGQIMKSFVIPRGISMLAGGTCSASATEFSLSAKEGSPTYGILHNTFLETEFKIVGFELAIKIHDPMSFSYDQNTILKMKNRSIPFDHRDRNTLRKVKV